MPTEVDRVESGAERPLKVQWGGTGTRQTGSYPAAIQRVGTDEERSGAGDATAAHPGQRGGEPRWRG